jgi:hypothetical protein
VTYRKDIWTYLLVTAVTLLIWWWAAGETREQQDVTMTVQFVTDDPDLREVTLRGQDATQAEVAVKIEGSRLALQDAERVLRAPLLLELGRFDLRNTKGNQTLNTASVLANHPRITDTKVSIVSADPSVLEIAVDDIVRRTVPVPIDPPSGVDVQGEIDIDPDEVEIVLPSRYLPADPAALAVEKDLDPQQLARLEPGRSTSLDVRLRPREARLRGVSAVRIEPPTVKMSFTVRSRTRQITLPTVRVQIQSPPEDFDEYVVTIDERDKILRDVTIVVDGDLASRIEAGEVPVMAVVQLSTADKESSVDRKRVTFFVALLPNGEGIQVALAQDGGPVEPPTIGLTITERPSG